MLDRVPRTRVSDASSTTVLTAPAASSRPPPSRMAASARTSGAHRRFGGPGAGLRRVRDLYHAVSARVRGRSARPSPTQALLRSWAGGRMRHLPGVPFGPRIRRRLLHRTGPGRYLRGVGDGSVVMSRPGGGWRRGTEKDDATSGIARAAAADGADAGGGAVTGCGGEGPRRSKSRRGGLNQPRSISGYDGG